MSDVDDEMLVAELRELVRRADPVPPDVATIAQMAYEFRNVTVVPTSVTPDELALVRSADTLDLQLVSQNGVDLAWRVDDGLVVGTLKPADRTCSIVTADERVTDVPLVSGGFEFDEPDTPWRLQISGPHDEVWATEWQPAKR